ncbi:MAG: DNA-processing protein DprA [Candidatus Sericytochromatia bacterium]
MDERMCWVAWSRIPKLGGRRLTALQAHFGSLEAAWAAPAVQLAAVPDWGPKLAAEAAAARLRQSPEAVWASVVKPSVRIVTWVDPDYPAPLRGLLDPPPVLYVMGELPDWTRAIAMVGMRDASPYGLRVARQLAKELAALGAVIVSGVAHGIDRAAHEGALSVGDGLTAGVLGGGFKYVYPAANRDLYRAIADGGALITEYPYDVEPEKAFFPMRNRIISGLSNGVIVVEARRKSGTLHTVDHALDQGRHVLAVPGPIDSPGSEGPHDLIRQGARLVNGLADVLEEFGWAVAQAPVTPPKTSDNPLEQSILNALAAGPKQLDGVAAQTGLDAPSLGGLLTMMEIRGLVRALPGQRYALA